MNCPYCGEEMEAGTIQSNGSTLLFAVREYAFLKLARDGDVQLARGFDSSVSADRCPACKKNMIDYSTLGHE